MNKRKLLGTIIYFTENKESCGLCSNLRGIAIRELIKDGMLKKKVTIK